jgi:hypothetical protein
VHLEGEVVGQRADQAESPATFALGVGLLLGPDQVLVVHGDQQRAVGDGDPQLDRGAGVQHGVGDQLAGQQQQHVEGLLRQRRGVVADEGACGAHQPRQRLELQGVRLDHRIVVRQSPREHALAAHAPDPSIVDPWRLLWTVPAPDCPA